MVIVRPSKRKIKKVVHFKSAGFCKLTKFVNPVTLEPEVTGGWNSWLCTLIEPGYTSILDGEKNLVPRIFLGQKLSCFWWNDPYLKQDNVAPRPHFHTIVLFKSLRNSKRRNKGNFTSKSNSNKIKLCRGGGQHYLVKRFNFHVKLIWRTRKILSYLIWHEKKIF